MNTQGLPFLVYRKRFAVSQFLWGISAAEGATLSIKPMSLPPPMFFLPERQNIEKVHGLSGTGCTWGAGELLDSGFEYGTAGMTSSCPLWAPSPAGGGTAGTAGMTCVWS